LLNESNFTDKKIKFLTVNEMRTQEARQIPITDYLDRIGAKFARTQNGTNGQEYVYHSPIRDDVKPSLCVNIGKNIWSDVPEGVGGRLIELVCHVNGLQKNDISGALKLLDGIFPIVSKSSLAVSSIISKSKLQSDQETSLFNYASLKTSDDAVNNATGLKKKSVAIEIKQVKPLFSFPLKNYLSDTRKINLNIADQYIKEVHCQLTATGNNFYAIGFKSGATYSLRNKNFKGFAGTGVDITIFDHQTSNILVFEGFIDFLSYLTAKKVSKPPFTCVVLNSSAMIGRLITYVNNTPLISSIDYFRDRDELEGKNTGLNTLKELNSQLQKIKIRDMSVTYPQYKDLNDWLVDQY